MGIRGREGWRIDPAKMAVGAAIDNTDAAMCGVAENQNWSAGHVEFRYGVADR